MKGIIQPYSPVELKMYSKALDLILPDKEAEPYIPDFKYLSKKRKEKSSIEH